MAGAAGCNKKSEPLSERPAETTRAATQAPTETPTEASTDKSIKGINPLTGESGYNESADGKRPVSVMVNNLKDALPQYGVEQADIIFEVPVEGGITRLMAVYADYTAVPDVCSVRSCRYYYPLLSLGMDAIYCHWGSDQTIALETLERTKIDHIDGGYEKTMFYRDPERVGKYDSEHTGYLKGSELPAKIEEKGFRTDVSDFYKGTLFEFSQEDYVPAEMTASEVEVKFSDFYYSTFKYNEREGAYNKLHSGKNHIDGKTGNVLSFENVIVLQSDIHPRADGYLMDVALDGGSGYYFTMGGGQKITWKKKTESSPIELFGADGNELELNIGESYIGIIGAEKPVTIE